MPIQFRPVDFELITGNLDLQEFNKRVRKKLEEGWVLHGDTKFVYGSSGFSYAQAVARLDAVNVNLPGVPGGNILVPQ